MQRSKKKIRNGGTDRLLTLLVTVLVKYGMGALVFLLNFGLRLAAGPVLLQGWPEAGACHASASFLEIRYGGLQAVYLVTLTQLAVASAWRPAGTEAASVVGAPRRRGGHLR